MKKTTLSLCAIAAIVLFSCSKDQITNEQPRTPEKKIEHVQIVSDWMTMNFTQGTKYNPDGLEATQYFNPSSIYNESETTRMAFVRTADSYKTLPATVFANGVNLDISYLLTYASFTVMVNDADGQGVPAISSLDNCQFRYIVVSNSLLHNLDIDWNDYSAVAKALDIQN